MHMTRRNVLKAGSLAALAAQLSRSVAQAESTIVKKKFVASGSCKDTQTAVGGICEMCFWRCQMVGKIRDGRLVKLEGNPKSVDNGLSLCARGNAGIKLLYDPDRLNYPLKNVGRRGAPQWQRISWEEALEICGQRLKTIVEQSGPEAIALFPHGSSASYPLDFFERTVGTPNISEPAFFQCRGIRDVAYMATIDTPPNEDADMANAKVLFLLGCHFGENIHVSHVKRYLKGLENGARLVVVDPRYSAAAAKSHIWMAIRPGTDTAMLLAIMNYLIQNGHYDAEFVRRHGEGFAEMAAGIREWTFEKVAAECDVPAAQLKEVADLLAAHRPNVTIHPGRHVSWNGNDFQRQRALACLTGILGAYGVPGGFVPVKGPKGLGKVKWPKRGAGAVRNLKELAGLYPFAPPGTPTDLIRDTAISGKPYAIRGCVIWNQNLIQTIPNQAKTIQMLEQMEFVMCVDVLPTDITRYADILLPDCSFLERYDNTVKTGTQWDLADTPQQYIAPRMPLVAPGFERKDAIWITNELARRMGYGAMIPAASQEELIDKILGGVDLSIAQIRAEGGIHLQPGEDPYGLKEDFTVKFFSEELEAAGFPAIPTYIPVERAPEGYARLIYGRSPVHTFNRTQNNAWLMAEMGDNPIWVNDKLASRLGLREGDTVALVNQDGVRSRTATRVKVTPGIREDAVFLVHGFGSASPDLTIGCNRGLDDQSLVTRLAVDPETGCHGMRNNFVRLVKVG